MQWRLSRSEAVMVTAPSLVVVLGLYLPGMCRDTFSQDLQALAGEGAIHCGKRECKVVCFQRRQPFWTRTEHHYENLLSCNTEPPTDVSEAEVFTATGEYYELFRSPPSGLRPARIFKRRWVNPHFLQGPAGELFLWRDGVAEIRN